MKEKAFKMTWKSNLYIRFIVERFLAICVLGGISILYMFIPFHIIALVIFIAIMIFGMVLYHQDNKGITANIVTFVYSIVVILLVMVQMTNYVHIEKDIRLDKNVSFVYDTSESGYTIYILKDNKIDYSFTTSNEVILKQKTLDINITQRNEWYAHELSTYYKVIK